MSLIAPACATSGCHDRESHLEGLDLSEPERAYQALWNRPSRQVRDGSVRLVWPFAPERSYLIAKLRGTAPFGERMPLGRDLPNREEVIDSIVTWINQGATNN